MLAALAIYLEYASLYPNRSGGQVAYLEQAFPKPAFLFPVTYAFFTVVFSFSSSNAVVLARYIYRAAGYTASEWENKGLAMASYTFLAFLVYYLFYQLGAQADANAVFDLYEMVNPPYELDLRSQTYHPFVHRRDRIRRIGRRHECARPACQLPQLLRWYHQQRQ